MKRFLLRFTQPVLALLYALAVAGGTHAAEPPAALTIADAVHGALEEIGKHLEMALQSVLGTRTVFAERVTGGYDLDFDLKRQEIARYGIALDEVQMAIETVIRGESITTTVEGRERCPVSVRYARELRDDPDRLKRVLIPAMNGAQIPLAARRRSPRSDQRGRGHDRWSFCLVSA